MDSGNYFLEAEITSVTPNFEDGSILCVFATGEKVVFSIEKECFDHGKLGRELRNREVFDSIEVSECGGVGFSNGYDIDPAYILKHGNRT